MCYKYCGRRKAADDPSSRTFSRNILSLAGDSRTSQRTLGRSRTMINGAHIIIYSKDAEADITFIKNVLKFKYVDVQKGWLIFKLPPSEVAVHPSDENDMHEFYLMTDNLESEIKVLEKEGVSCDTVT